MPTPRAISTFFKPPPSRVAIARINTSGGKARRASMNRIIIYGRIDEVVFEPTRIIIIDDKPDAQPYFTNKIQVWGYCQTFTETYGMVA
jgi:hypothetical protein